MERRPFIVLCFLIFYFFFVIWRGVCMMDSLFQNEKDEDVHSDDPEDRIDDKDTDEITQGDELKQFLQEVLLTLSISSS